MRHLSQLLILLIAHLASSFNIPHLWNEFGQKPDYSLLRVFRCACWPNLRPYNSRKLEFRSQQCVFLGYSPLHKGFKCLHVSTGRVYISRDVIFDENIFPFTKLHSNAGALLRSEVLLVSTSSSQPNSVQ